MFSEGQIVIYVFSDDIAFCRNYFSRKEEFLNQGIIFRYVQYESSNYTLDDLLIMSKCKNMIMANSSYSWWAAWLNQHEDKVVICPKLHIWKGDFYPEEWIKINCESSLNQADFQ